MPGRRPWLGQAFETWHSQPPTLLGQPGLPDTMRFRYWLLMGWLFPHSTHPLGLPRAVATQTSQAGQHASSDTYTGVQLSRRAGRNAKGGPVRLPDKTEWSTAAAASHSSRDTSGALELHPAGGAWVSGGDWRPGSLAQVFQTGPRRRVWTSVRQVHPYLVSARYPSRKDAGNCWPSQNAKSQARRR
ncbi:uncharacterized protein B0H64DRAFT_126903 [Chaetomium fimeti]|uniref:Uncharacterized protein n=1 Tax=Chaetomium fimeti TaxID=1854472 RepID=A0AAE0LUQ3_9PEZI|nr:hypothetical protein B0H64DRAFT_126903 [Chaetomium fimeti]